MPDSQSTSRSPTARRLVVALHDVAPPFETEIRAQLEALQKIGVARTALKVVPNWTGKYPIDRFSSFMELLRHRQQSGDQIVLHGWEHRVHGKLGGSLAQRVRASLFARQSEEFLSLSRTESGRAVKAGIELFEECGLGRPTTFSPPAWLISSDAEGGVADGGIRYLVKMFTLSDLQTGGWTRVPAFGHMGAGSKQEFGVQLMNRIVRGLWLPRSNLVKVFLHPSGGAESAAFRRTLEAIEGLLREGWETSTYEDVIGQPHD